MGGIISLAHTNNKVKLCPPVKILTTKKAGLTTCGVRDLDKQNTRDILLVGKETCSVY